MCSCFQREDFGLRPIFITFYRRTSQCRYKNIPYPNVPERGVNKQQFRVYREQKNEDSG